MTQSEFMGSSMRDAIEKAKKILGDDAYIIKSEQTEKGVKIFAEKSEDELFLSKPSLDFTTKSLAKVQRKPILIKDLQKQKALDAQKNTDPITLIKRVVSICDKHKLDRNFCDSWIDLISKNFSNSESLLEDTLSQLIKFSPSWIHTLSADIPVTFVGPHGEGKTAFIGKLAVVLKTLDRNIRVITLDEKAGAFQQLKTYMDMLEVSVQQGIEHYLTEKNTAIQNNEILLVDTPGIDILLKSGQEYLFKLSEQVKTPLTLVLPNDMDASLRMEMATEFVEYNAQYLVGTRFDTYTSYGSFFNCAHKHKLTPLLYSSTPAISTPPNVLSVESTFALFEE